MMIQVTTRLDMHQNFDWTAHGNINLTVSQNKPNSNVKMLFWQAKLSTFK